MYWKNITKRTSSPWVKEELVGSVLSSYASGTSALGAGSHTASKLKKWSPSRERNRKGSERTVQWSLTILKQAY